jgi:hypothetical protein
MKRLCHPVSTLIRDEIIDNGEIDSIQGLTYYWFLLPGCWFLVVGEPGTIQIINSKIPEIFQ